MADTIKLEGSRALDFDREMVEQAYDRWAPVYDLVFGGASSIGRKAAIQATNTIGGRVLEQGSRPVVRPLGFRTAEFAWSGYAQWLSAALGMERGGRRLVPPLGHFSLVRFRKVDVAK